MKGSDLAVAPSEALLALRLVALKAFGMGQTMALKPGLGWGRKLSAILKGLGGIKD